MRAPQAYHRVETPGAALSASRAAGAGSTPAQHLRDTFGNARGWLILAYGHAPAGADRQFNHKRYFQYPAQLDQAAAYALDKAQQGYDVGFVVNLVTRKPEFLRGERLDAGFITRYGVPLDFLYADDLRPGGMLQASTTIETSRPAPGKYPQGILRLDQRLMPAERAELSRRWAASTGADASGSDVTQILRLAGTRNYKRATPHQVRYQQHGGAQPVDQVRAALAGVRLAPAAYMGNRRDDIARGQQLAGAILPIPRQKALAEARRLARGGYLAQLLSSTSWHDRSAGYFSLIEGLYMRLRNWRQVAALAVAIGDQDHHKTEQRLLDDTYAIIGKLDNGYKKHGQAAAARQKDAPMEKPAAKAGKPAQRTERRGQALSLGAAALYDHIWQQWPESQYSRNAELASMFNVSERAVRYWLAELVTAGLLVEHGQGRARRLVLAEIPNVEAKNQGVYIEHASSGLDHTPPVYFPVPRAAEPGPPTPASTPAAATPGNPAAAGGCAPLAVALLPPMVEASQPAPVLVDVIRQIAGRLGWDARRVLPEVERLNPGLWPRATQRAVYRLEKAARDRQRYAEQLRTASDDQLLALEASGLPVDQRRAVKAEQRRRGDLRRDPQADRAFPLSLLPGQLGPVEQARAALAASDVATARAILASTTNRAARGAIRLLLGDLEEVRAA